MPSLEPIDKYFVLKTRISSLEQSIVKLTSLIAKPKSSQKKRQAQLTEIRNKRLAEEAAYESDDQPDIDQCTQMYYIVVLLGSI